MTTCIIMVGLPGAGKSSAAAGFGCPVVSLDAIRREVFGVRWYEGLEPNVFRFAAQMANALLAVHDQVVIDDVNHTRERRQYWRRNVRADDFTFRMVRRPLDDCIRDDARRERPVGRDVIVQMHNEFEDVFVVEGTPVTGG